MASDALALAYQPTCEDYDSDESSARVLESLRRSPSSHPNVAAKRSPADAGGEKAPAVQQQQRVPVNIDLQSDSGYSSHTAATMSSADSAPSFSSMRPTMPPVVVAAPFPSQSPANRNRRPTLGDPRQSSSQSLPRPKGLSRRDSQSAKRPPAQRRPTITQERNESRDDDCTDPNCTTCGPNAAVQRRRADPPPSDSALDVSYPYDPRSQRSDTASPYASPPSPTYARQPQYAQGAAIAQPGQTRRRSSSNARQRPLTHNGDGPGYWVQGMPAPYPSPPQEHGPPPSASAYRNMQQYPQMASYMAPPAQPNGFYTPASSIHQTSPPYESQRPSLSARTSSSYSRTNYAPPVVTQDRNERPMYSARYSQPPPSTSQPKFTPQPLQLQEGSSDSESESEPEYLPDPRDVRALMPPPKITSSTKRPSMRKAKTTQVVERVDRGERPERPARPDRRMSQSINNIPERPSPRDRDRDRERPSRPSATLTRGPSVHRPALVQQRQTQSAYDTPHARVIVENSKSNRRQSYQGQDKVKEQYARAQEMQYISEKKLQKRSSKTYREERREPVEYSVEQKRRNRTSKVYQDDRYEPEEDKTEQKRRNRVSRVIQPERFESDASDAEGQVEEMALVPLSTRRRRDTDADARRGKDRTPEPRNKSIEMAAEEYMKATRGDQTIYTDQVHKAAKRASRAPSGRPSESGSSQSKGSDKESQSNRTAITSGGPNDVIRLRVDASAPLSLSFNGDMEGRTLQFTPAENGMADIVIGGARGNENTYQSEKGSVMGSSRKNLIANQAWDAEDVSERSSRSGRSKRENRESREIRDDREEPRRILARRRDTHYH